MWADTTEDETDESRDTVQKALRIQSLIRTLSKKLEYIELIWSSVRKDVWRTTSKTSAALISQIPSLMRKMKNGGEHYVQCLCIRGEAVELGRCMEG
jgi:hypothetical protein